jgi:hypothetical protein
MSLYRRAAAHRKLTEEQITLLTEQAGIRAREIGYRQLAHQCGLTYESCKQLMAELIREHRRGFLRVRRGTDRGELALREMAHRGDVSESSRA